MVTNGNTRSKRLSEKQAWFNSARFRVTRRTLSVAREGLQMGMAAGQGQLRENRR